MTDTNTHTVPVEQERYRVELEYVRGDNTGRRVFSTTVEITSDDPFTLVSDIAHERLYESSNGSTLTWEVLGEVIHPVG